MKIHLITVNMGYGHQRAAYPLSFLAYDRQMIFVNSYSGMPKRDKKIWQKSRKSYEFISRFKHFPLVGDIAFDVFDKFQAISPFYPKRDLSKPSLQLKSTITLIRKKKWGAHLIDKLNKKPLPLVTTFFVPAFMAEEHGYKDDIYLVVCDADISRAWAPYAPRESRIKYLAPNKRVIERLKLYGVREKNIFLTGFPLPEDMVGGEKLKILKHDLGARLANLDRQSLYRQKYQGIAENLVGSDNIPRRKIRPLTITFAVGGAGAQRETGIAIIMSLKNILADGKARVNLVAGIHNDVRQFFENEIAKLHLSSLIGSSINIVSASTRESYFAQFNKIIRQTDILWTKPSELSFYAALGLPIVMSEPLGSQEKFNREWLMTIGAGIDQKDTRYANEWLFEWLEGGVFAALAVHGFQEAAKFGSYNISKIINHEEIGRQRDKLVLQY